MLMVMKEHTIGAGEFKATCLALLDAVARTGRSVVVTKRGKAVARLVPLEKRTPRRPFADSIVFVADDIVEPIGDAWDVDG